MLNPVISGLTDCLFPLSRQMQSEFAKERDWDQFHQPRNLVLAMVQKNIPSPTFQIHKFITLTEVMF